MTEKKNPDYSATAVNLRNPPQVEQKLMALCEVETHVTEINDQLGELPIYLDLKQSEATALKLREEINLLINDHGSYQDIARGWYAIKQLREKKEYKPDLARRFLALKLQELVIVESVDSKALEGLVKGGLVDTDTARKCAEIKETFAYIVRWS